MDLGGSDARAGEDVEGDRRHQRGKLCTRGEAHGHIPAADRGGALVHADHVATQAFHRGVEGAHCARRGLEEDVGEDAPALVDQRHVAQVRDEAVARRFLLPAPSARL